MTIPEQLESYVGTLAKWPGTERTINLMCRAANRIRKLEAEVRNMKDDKEGQADG